MDIYLDTAASGRVMAHLLEPPGLGMRFESREEMAHRLPGAIRAHLGWLASHGESVASDPHPTYRIVEEVAMAGNFESGDDVGIFRPDFMPVTDPEIERYLRIAGSPGRLPPSRLRNASGISVARGRRAGPERSATLAARSRQAATA